ncbi:hypothetical protein [Phaffia rhodozyma]|uniref:Uncharacterized protein n=1 Tax=Phaffia rhodozyma TaxID=264483 RepID=A0A0F7SS12_PHARH|nr:hypothetical protein [Phaffia rhodozyma]
MSFPSAADVPGLSDDQTVNSPQRSPSIRERTASFTNRIRTSSTSSLNKLKRSASSASVSPSTVGHADGPPISPSAGSSSSERKNRRISLSKIFSGSSGNGRNSDKNKSDHSAPEGISPDSPSSGSRMSLSKSMSFGSLRSKKEAKSLHRSSHQSQRTHRTPLTPEALPPQLSRSVTPPGQSPNPSLPRSTYTGIPSPSSRRVVSPAPMTANTSTFSSAASSPSRIPRRIRVSSNPSLPPQIDTLTSPVRARASTSHMATPDNQQHLPQVLQAKTPIASSSSSRSLSRASQAPSFLLEDPFSTPPPPEVVQPSTSSATAVSPSSSPSTAFDLLQMIQRERSNKSAHTTSTNGERTSSNLKRSSSQAESILGGVLEREVEGGGRVSRSPSATRRRRLTGDMMRPREVSLSAKAESLNSPDMKSQAGGSSGVDSMILTPESPRSQHSPVAFGEDSILGRGVQEALGPPLREPARIFSLPSSPPSSVTPDKIPIPLTDELMEALKLGRVMPQSSPLPKAESTGKDVSTVDARSEEIEAEEAAPEHQLERAIPDEALTSDEPANRARTPSVEARLRETEVFNSGANANVSSNDREDVRDDAPSNLPRLGLDPEHVPLTGRAEHAQEVQEGAGIDEDDDHLITPTTTERSSAISSPRLSYISEESSNAAGDVGGDGDNDQESESGEDINSEDIREILKGFSSRQPMSGRTLDESQSGTFENVEGHKNVENEKNDYMPEARGGHQDSSKAPDSSISASSVQVSNTTTKPISDEHEPTLVSAMRLPKESSGLSESIQSDLSSTRNDSRSEPMPSSGSSAKSPPVVDDAPTTSDDHSLLGREEEVKHIKVEQPVDEKSGDDQPVDVLSPLTEGARSDLRSQGEDDAPQDSPQKKEEGERTPVGLQSESLLGDGSSQKQVETDEARQEVAHESSRLDDKTEEAKEGFHTTLEQTTDCPSPLISSSSENPLDAEPTNNTEDSQIEKQEVPDSPILPKYLPLRLLTSSSIPTDNSHLDQNPVSLNTPTHDPELASTHLSDEHNQNFSGLPADDVVHDHKSESAGLVNEPAKEAEIEKAERDIPTYLTPVVKISSSLTPQSSPEAIQEGMYDLGEPSSPLNITDQQTVSHKTSPVDSKLKLSSDPSSDSPGAIILPPDVPSTTTIDDVSPSTIKESMPTTPSLEREDRAIQEGASASIAEQTLKQVLDPKRVLIEDKTGELASYEARIASADRNLVDKGKEHRQDSLVRDSGAQTKLTRSESSESLPKEPLNKAFPSHHISEDLQHEEQPGSALPSTAEDDPGVSLGKEQDRKAEISSATLPSSTHPTSMNTQFSVNGETKDEPPKHFSDELSAETTPSISKTHPQPLEPNTAVISDQPLPPKATSTPLVSSPTPFVAADVSSSSSRPNLPSRALTTPTRSSTPQRPQLPRAATTNSINTFELPNPFASLLNSQRFFIRIPVSLLPTRLASFAQQPTFSIPSFFPGAVDPSEGSRSRSHSPDSVQTIGYASTSNDGTEPVSGFGSGLESGKALLGTAASIVGTSVKWGFGWPVLVPLRAGQYVLTTLSSHAGLGVDSAVREKDKSVTTVANS